uniref:Uncharacterized protein n=1 Tax=Myoviridae sp. ctqfO1 TaxID=2827710 RepID=A0A8S5T2E9_9CAUD|nr:MAG TPA: hypothetical protein [Myoviridae sp. ctqfO1]
MQTISLLLIISQGKCFCQHIFSIICQVGIVILKPTYIYFYFILLNS